MITLFTRNLCFSGFLHIPAAVLSAIAFFGCDVGQTSDQTSGSGGGGGAQASSSPASSSTGAGGGSATGSGSGNPGGGYYTQGNTIYDSNGVPHQFHGIARPSLEWNAQGENLSTADHALIAGWGANVVRLALNQRFWLTNPAYEGTVDDNVQWAKMAGMDVILDLHWSDKGDPGTQPGQQRMADANSLTFWQAVAAKYKDDHRVLFELYNEPHDVSWDVWRNGGPSGDGFTVVGMQQLYDAVRATGAQNLVIIGGLDHAYDLSGVASHRINGTNIIYATHPYNFPNKQPADWPADWGYLAATDPVMITEFGVISGSCDSTYYSQVIDYAKQQNVSWTAWAWYVKDCAFPSLITTWNGDPSAAGQVVRTALQAF
jgi:endoglucanase